MQTLIISCAILVIIAATVRPSAAHAVVEKRTPGLDGDPGVPKRISRPLVGFSQKTQMTGTVMLILTDSTGPVNAAAAYRAGYCGVHVTQYQKANPAVDSYALDITIYDANQAVVGLTGGPWPSANGVNLYSQLPWALGVYTGAVDEDPVYFAYADQSWNSFYEQCTFGLYDGGQRSMDCGFFC